MKSSFIKMKWQVILVTLLVGVSLFFTLRAYSQEDEAPVTVTGLLEVMIAEDFRQAGQEQVTEMSYWLRVDSGLTYQLQFAGTSPPPDLTTGQRAKVTGIATGTTLWVETLTPEPYPQAPVVGDRRVVVLMVDLQDIKASDRYTPQQVADGLFTGIRSVRDLYFQNSFGQLNFVADSNGDNAPDVFGPFLINYSYNPSTVCDYFNWTLAAEAAAQNAGIDLSPYRHRIIVLPSWRDLPSCSWSGRATVGCGSWCRSWITEAESPMVFAHELGHNLGLAHAGTDPENDGIANSEYGDYSDPMGGSRAWHLFAGPHSDRLGWYEAYPGSLVTVTQSGDYTIDVLNAIPPVPSGNPRILRLQRPNNQGFYYLSYRQPVAYDDSLFLNYTWGVSVHRYQGPTAAYQTFFIQALNNNQSFVDSAAGIRVTQTGVGPDRATVHVDLCIGQNPIVTLAPPSQALRPGNPASYTVTITNQDGALCPPATFTLSYTGAPPGTLTPASLQLAPGTGGIATLAVTTAGMASNAYPLQVQAANSNATGTGGSGASVGAGSTTLIVDGDLPTPPTGLQGSVNSQGWVTLGWNAASDALSGIQSYAIYRDGVFLATTGNLSYTDTTTVPDTTYSYTVTATDGLGNVSAASTPLTVFSTCYANAPLVTISPASLLVKPNGNAVFSVSVTNNDSAHCAPTTWTLSRLDAAGTLSPATLRLAPGQKGTATLVADTAVAGTFTVVAQAADNDGVEPNHAQSGTGSATLLIDSTPPTAPTDLQASIDGQGRIALSWNAATDVPSGVDSYRVYRGGVLIGQTTTLNYFDTPALGPTYRYTVTAVDKVGNESSPSNGVDVITVCTAANPIVTLIPAPLASKLSIVTNYTVTVSNNDTGPCAATTFTLASSANSSKVTRTWSSASLSVNPGQSATTTLGVKTTTAGNYTVSVKATDSDGKVPNHSTAITGSAQFIGDSTAPTAPTNLQATSNDGGAAQQLSWSAATDSGSGVRFYTVTRNGVAVAQLNHPTTAYTDATVPGTSYTYSVTATDKAGNVSLQSNTLQLLAGCSAQAPLVMLAPSSQAVKAGVAAGYTVTVLNQDGLTYCPATSFTLSYSGTPTGTLTPTSLALSPGQSGAATLQVKTTSSGSFPIQINAADSDGIAPSHLAGTGSATFVSDGTAPTVPSGLKATVSPGQIVLTWNAATDALSSVQSYLVYRGSTLLAEVPSPTTSYTDTTVVKGTSYTYTVAAKDVFGNVSSKSTSVKPTAQ
ncbi:MAG: hypothetical protein U1F76_28620 [Candidatus Competibacteraceae bacterium]